MDEHTFLGYRAVDLGPGEAHECCGPIVPAYAATDLLREDDDQPIFFQCSGCGELIGITHAPWWNSDVEMIYADID